MIIFGGLNYAIKDGKTQCNAILVWDWNREDAEKQALQVALSHFLPSDGWTGHGSSLTNGVEFPTPNDLEAALAARTEQCATELDSLIESAKSFGSPILLDWVLEAQHRIRALNQPSPTEEKKS